MSTKESTLASTVDMRQAETLASDVFLQAETVLRMIGDCGGARCLARLINALAADAVLNFRDLLPLDSENRALALMLIKEFLNEAHSEDEWKSLAELANCCAYSGEWRGPTTPPI